jgi:hypothetical protein
LDGVLVGVCLLALDLILPHLKLGMLSLEVGLSGVEALNLLPEVGNVTGRTLI